MVGDSRTDDFVTPTSNEQSLNVMYDALSHQRRRYVLASLMKHRESIALGELAEEVAARESRASNVELSDREVRKVETTLYHHHLPKLAETGVIEYDPEQPVIQLSGDTEQIEYFISQTMSVAKEL